jgi:hypothetical protein
LIGLLAPGAPAKPARTAGELTGPA